MFESSHPFAFFDYFRIPYQVRLSPPGGGQSDEPAPVHRLRATGQAGQAQRSMLWPCEDALAAMPPSAFRLGRYTLGNRTFFGHVALNAGTPALLEGLGREWRRAEQILDNEGRAVAAVWRDRNGSVFLPFDPGEVMRQFWSERYLDIGRPALAATARAALLRGYYLVRPALPRPVQLRLRRAFTSVQSRSAFPRWPIEDSLHDLYTWLIGLVAELAGRPVPFLDPWPDGRSCALVLTHDVETETGYRDIELLREPERELGLRSSWNLVALRYRVDDSIVRALHGEGCEVGVHGLRHDGRDLGSRRLLGKRLAAMHAYAKRWSAVGFRSPGTQREWELMARLGFEYDSSYPDTDPYEPQPGGCCTYLPFFNDRMVELPITLPQDHTLSRILRMPDAGIWTEKAQFLRERHAMVLVLTHPDYARDQILTDGYRKLLGQFGGDETVWHALPREVAAWWRQRDTSTIRADGDHWVIDGPAASRGRVRFATPAGFYPTHQWRP